MLFCPYGEGRDATDQDYRDKCSLHESDHYVCLPLIENTQLSSDWIAGTLSRKAINWNHSSSSRQQRQDQLPHCWRLERCLQARLGR